MFSITLLLGLKLINRLKGDFSNKLINNSIEAATVAYDVFINTSNANGETVKRNALCLMISIDGENWSEDYYPYEVVNNECIWG